jgi:hypothetical protein
MIDKATFRDFWLQAATQLVKPEWVEPYREEMLSGDPYRQLAALQAIFSQFGRDTSDDRHRWN